MAEYGLDAALWPAGMSVALRSALERIVARARELPEVLGIAAGGSFISGGMDEYSDLDLILLVEPSAWEDVMGRRVQMAQSMGPLLTSFTGEHVGEPRLLICIFGPPMVHVDLKFMVPDMLAKRVEDPVVVWERDGAMSAALDTGTPRYPQPSLQWIEDRFWGWVHYECAKIGRGELFEAISGLDFLRTCVLGPLALMEVSARPSGVRRLEAAAPRFAEELKSSLAAYDARDIMRAMSAAIGLYRGLRDRIKESGFSRRVEVEEAAMDYLSEVSKKMEE